MAMEPNTALYNWAATSGSTIERARAAFAMNQRRIDELKRELATLGPGMDPRDELDMELAANRARAYDMPGAESSLNRVQTRFDARRKADQEEANRKAVKEYETASRVADIEQNINRLQLEKFRAKTALDKGLIDNQLDREYAKLAELGKDPRDFQFRWSGMEDLERFRKDIKDSTHYDSAGNRRWNDDVTEDDKVRFANRASELGLDEEFKSISTMPTKSERKRAAAMAAAKEIKAANVANDVARELKDPVARVNFAIEWNLGQSDRVKILKEHGYTYNVDTGILSRK